MGGDAAITPAERRVIDAVHRRHGSMEADLASLVAIPTGCGHRQGLDAARVWMRARFEALGARVERVQGGDRPSWLREGASGDDAGDVLIARSSGSPNGPRLLLSGHLDTVHDPHGSFCSLAAERGGMREGPGAADMKGGLIVALAALESLAEVGVHPHWTFLLNADEETGSFRSAAILERVAHECDVGLVLEPAVGSDFVMERPGSAQFRIDAKGRAAHAGRDAAQGVSAVHALAKAICTVLAANDPANGCIVNIGPLEGGRATNVVPADAAAWGNARYFSAEAREQVERALASVAKGESALPRVSVEVLHNRPAKPATEAVQALARCAVECAAKVGTACRAVSTGGVSDANVLQHAGLPCLDGLGVRGGNLHRTDEYVVLSSLCERAAILALLMRRIMESPPVPCRP